VHSRDLQEVLDKGIKSIAVVLKHSAIYPDHEEAVGRLAKEMGFEQVRSTLVHVLQFI
jgi:5-oxoprolinase (ATP-hydrolysing)